MALVFLLCGALSALLTRNAIIVVIMSACALPIAGIVAVVARSDGSAIATAFWCYGAFVLGAALGFAALVIASLLYPERSKTLKVTLFRNPAEQNPGQ